MAVSSSTPLSFLPSFLVHPTPHYPVHLPLLRIRRRTLTHLSGNGGDLLGDFGARDPFPEEIESRFGEKVLGLPDTEHRILIPNLAALSLANLTCDHSPLRLGSGDAKNLLNKVVGWRVTEEDGIEKLHCLWKVRDYASGVELINRIFKVIEASGHFPCLHLDQSNQVRAELWTQSVGGLSMNDFIVAAKIDEIKTMDLIPKRRAWA